MTSVTDEQRRALARVRELVEYLDTFGHGSFDIRDRRLYTDDLRPILDLQSALAQSKAPLTVPGEVAHRILVALGGLRDDMPPGDVAAVQRFVAALRSNVGEG